MWDITVPIVGRCRTCGEQLDTRVRVCATPAWATHYHADEALRRRVERAIVRRVVERHAHVCRGNGRIHVPQSAHA